MPRGLAKISEPVRLGVILCLALLNLFGVEGHSPCIIQDNIGSGFSLEGSWRTLRACCSSYGTSCRSARPGVGAASASWTLPIASEGLYEISAWWVVGSDRAPDAPYSIYNNEAKLGTIHVNQTKGKSQFNPLGTYQLQPGKVKITLNDTTSGSVVADAIRLIFLGDKLVKITSPSSQEVQTSGHLMVRALAGSFPADWGVEFMLDGSAESTFQDHRVPFEWELEGLSADTHTIDAYVVDSSGARQEPFFTRVRFGVGDNYVAFGDSITRGSMDDQGADDVSRDGRNGGGGYEPILNDLLTAQKGYPQTVVNEGVSGHTSEDGATRISAILNANPHAQRFLIMYGSNDADLPVPSGVGLSPGDPGYSGSYKENMQHIISAISQSGRTPMLAKVPISLANCKDCPRFPDPDAAPRNAAIREYNKVVDELLASNHIRLEPPDLYRHFRDHPAELADAFHPNGAGYRSIAKLWFSSLTSCN